MSDPEAVQREVERQERVRRREEIRRRLAEKAAEKPAATGPAPRYDEVYFEGVAHLDALANERGLWRCEGCGDAYDLETDKGAWRWTGLIYEHKCPGLEPQVGHMPARFFGAVSQPDGHADAVERGEE